jgi:acyl carrier protein
VLNAALTEAVVSDRVVSAIAEAMERRGLESAAIRPDAKLADTLGLKSMDLAEIVLTLEDELGADPFREIPFTSVRSVSDLTSAYLVALGLADRAAAGGPGLEAEMAATRQRRGRRR